MRCCLRTIPGDRSECVRIRERILATSDSGMYRREGQWGTGASLGDDQTTGSIDGLSFNKTVKFQFWISLFVRLRSLEQRHLLASRSQGSSELNSHSFSNLHGIM